MMDRPTLLLADDDPTIITALTPFLERAGFHVLTATNGKDALEKAQSHRPDLIVLDVLMPRMDGCQVLCRLYVAPRVTQLDLPADTFGIPPDAREVYVADDANIPPDDMDIQFSHGNKYLLTQVFPHFVVVSLQGGQSTPLAIPHLDPFVWDDNYLGDPSFFSWRQ